MGKRKAGKFKKKDKIPSKKRPAYASDDDDDMNDEIDAFHKQRDVVPLDVNEDAMESDDEDNEHPVFNLKEDDSDSDSDDDEDDDEDFDDTGLAAKIVRQTRYLRAKTGGVEDEMHDEGEDEEEGQLWGGKKNIYYHGDNVEVRSSDDESLAEEEAEVLRLQKEQSKSLTAEDFGLEDVSQDESERELTFEEMSIQGIASNVSGGKEDGRGTTYEEVKRDLNALTKEEQMDVLYSSAPELVGLLSELSDAFEELESKVCPLLGKVRELDGPGKGVMQFLEVKQLLLLSYCQAITFYLLLKSDGQPVRDHPVISRLVEIKTLLDKIKVLDKNLLLELEDILNQKRSDERTEKIVEDSTLQSVLSSKDHQSPMTSIETTLTPQKAPEASVLLGDVPLKSHKSNGQKSKHQDHQVSVLSMEMLKVRAALEEKMKKKGLYSYMTKQNGLEKCLQPVNGKLETLKDFDDDAMDVDKHRKNNREGNLSLPKSLAPRENKSKVVSGDDDLPKRDDIGERRRKHELRVLAGAGVTSIDHVADDVEALASDGVADGNSDDESDSDLEFYRQVEQQHAAKVSAKSEIYSRPANVSSEPEVLVNGKRQITYQIEKNRGLTRARKKLTKNPRKKYKLKHEKAMVRRKGQVREIRKPAGPYGGETSGINPTISRSIRFKN